MEFENFKDAILNKDRKMISIHFQNLNFHLDSFEEYYPNVRCVMDFIDMMKLIECRVQEISEADEIDVVSLSMYLKVMKTLLKQLYHYNSIQ